MPTKEVIDNQGAKQRHADREVLGQTASGHAVFLGMDSAESQTTVGADGGATALTAHPVGYVLITIGGVLFKMPYYNP